MGKSAEEILKEKWVNVTYADFAHLYEVSSWGNVRSIKNGNLKPGINRKGYPCVSLSNKKVRKSPPVHRIVALAFISNPANKPTVNHIDGNKKNNNLSNLEWATYPENTLHSLDTGLNKTRKPVIVLKNGEFFKRFKCVHDAQKEFKVPIPEYIRMKMLNWGQYSFHYEKDFQTIIP